MAKSIRSKTKRKNRTEFRKTIGAVAAKATMAVVQSKMKECIEKGSMNSFERLSSMLNTSMEEDNQNEGVTTLSSPSIITSSASIAKLAKGENKAPMKKSKKRKHKLSKTKAKKG